MTLFTQIQSLADLRKTIYDPSPDAGVPAKRTNRWAGARCPKGIKVYDKPYEASVGDSVGGIYLEVEISPDHDTRSVSWHDYILTNRVNVQKICHGRYETESGMVCYFDNGRFHRSDGPAVYLKGQISEYWENGRHPDMPDDQPAVNNCYNGTRVCTQKWFKNYVLHRDNDMPAVIHGNERFWYQNGVLHRGPDKPAVTGANTQYYVHGVEYYEGKPDTRKIKTRFSRNGDIRQEHFMTFELPSASPSVHSRLDQNQQQRPDHQPIEI